jgi:hypothetical protein
MSTVALQFEARKVALKQDRSGYVLTLSLHPDEIPEELLRDFVGSRYACALVRIQDDESATPYKNRVQKAGILCRDPEFQQWVGAESEDEAASIVCERCEIESRSELNGNKEAQRLFDELVKDYEDKDDPF